MQRGIWKDELEGKKGGVSGIVLSRWWQYVMNPNLHLGETEKSKLTKGKKSLKLRRSKMDIEVPSQNTADAGVEKNMEDHILKGPLSGWSG